ncbi:Mg2+/Co2+ transporter CorB [Sinorhizobium terangae]|nr:Mg2+/Co2+ transporter CorB [Sinorhizobium terangae]
MTSDTLWAFVAEHWPSLVSVICLLLLSAFFSGSEAALTAASRARMHMLESNGDRRAGIVNRLIERRDRLVGTLLLGNNLVTILATSLATSLLIGLVGSSAVAVATLSMTVLLVVFAEVLPKSWAIASPDRFALAVAPLVRPFMAVAGPVSSLINTFVRRLLTLFGVNVSSDKPMLTAQEELRGAVDLLHREGSVIKADLDRLGGVLDLGELEVSDIMIHRTAMQAVNAEDQSEVCVRVILESPFTRLPLWRGSTDNIIGSSIPRISYARLRSPTSSPRASTSSRLRRSPGSSRIRPTSGISSMPFCDASCTSPSSSTNTARSRAS